MHMAIKGSAALLVVSAIVYALRCALAELVPEHATAAYYSVVDVGGACNYSKWQQVGKCSVTCGQGFADFQSSPASAKSCPVLKSVRPCDAGKCPVHCKGQWSSWDTCRPNCTKVRHYQILLPESLGGQPCSQEGAVESAACTDGSCSIDCEVGTWTAERCTRPCGGGQQVYRRPVVTAPLGRGRICPALEMWESCNTQECTYPKILAKLRDAVTNFSAGEPVLDVVKSEAEGFRSLAKTSHAEDVQGKEWGTFVDEVRVLSRDYKQGKKQLYQGLAKFMALSKQAPDELESLFQEFLARDWIMARRRFTRFAIKFAKVAQMIEEAHRSFMAMEKRAETYREKAVDQQETFQDIAADVYALGVSRESADFSGFAVEHGKDHRGSDIACGKFKTIHDLANHCLHDASCKAFTLRNGQPWCLKHLRYDDGPITDGTHVFYTKLVQSGRVVQSPDKVQAFLKRWSFAASFLMKVEETISRVAAKIGSIQQELEETEVILAELEGMLDANLEAQRRVEELIHDIASAFKTIVAYLEPMMK